MFAAITANSVQKRMGSLITSLCASSSFTRAGYVRGMVNFELSPLVPPKDPSTLCSGAPERWADHPSCIDQPHSEASAEVSTDCGVRKQEGGTWPFPPHWIWLPWKPSTRQMSWRWSCSVCSRSSWSAWSRLGCFSPPGSGDVARMPWLLFAGAAGLSVCSCSIAAFRWSLVSSFWKPFVASLKLVLPSSFLVQLGTSPVPRSSTKVISLSIDRA